MVDSERKLNELLDTVVEKRKKKGLTINCRKIECTIVSKTDSSSCELRIGNVKIKHEWNMNIVADDTKCNIEYNFRRHKM